MITSVRSLVAVLALVPAIAFAQPTATTTTTASPSSTSSASTLRPTTAATTSTTTAASTTTGTPAYCTTAPPRPAFDVPTGTTRPVPPLPCTGAYDAEKGLCCKSTDPNCSGSAVDWQLPLAPCVTANPLYRGCPGNMLNNVCCESARVAFSDGKVSCENGRSLFMVMTSAGKTVTSSFSAATTTGSGGSGQATPTANPASTTVRTTSRTGAARMPAPTAAAPVAAVIGILGAVIML